MRGVPRLRSAIVRAPSGSIAMSSTRALRSAMRCSSAGS